MRSPSSALSPKSIRQPFWSMTEAETLLALKTTQTGLTERAVEQRHNLFGANLIPLKRRMTKTKIVLNQLRSPLILVLIISGAITLYLQEYIDTAVIFLSVAINTLLGFWQENKAETVLEALTSYVRTRTRVRRNGTEQEIDAEHLVPGDVIRLAPGDRVPADVRFLTVSELEINESVVTGESLPVEKNVTPNLVTTTLADRTCMAWGGTLVTHGIGEAVVVATGADTEFGRIAAMIVDQPTKPTPLQRSVSRFTLVASLVLGGFALILFALGLFEGMGMYDTFLIAVAVGVSMVPESLPIAMTVILAVGVERLAKQRAVVRKLSAAETLGTTTVILTDKTGTLTEAKMSLARIVPVGSDTAETRLGLLRRALWNTDVVIENPEEKPEQWIAHGHPVEAALVRAAAEHGLSVDAHEIRSHILHRVPFDSQKKYSTSTVQDGSLRETVSLGAPDILLARSRLPEEQRVKWQQAIEQAANAGERVLGVATGTTTSSLAFQGIISFHDPLRPHVKETIRLMEQRGVKTVIVTGDHRGTAVAIAHEIGLMDGKGVAMTGEELATLSEHDLLGRLPDIRVFARVTPEQKAMIASLYRKTGARIAVVGDGVNDAPALEIADIGVAVGSGTEVAKSAADLVILDDNIETLVHAIEEGRRILQNIRKTIVYLLSDALDELLLIAGALLLGIPIPITALQILYVNLFSDSVPAIAFAFEREQEKTTRITSNPSGQLLDRRSSFLIFVIGSLGSAWLFFLYLLLLRLRIDTRLVQTFIFASFGTYTLFAAYSMRNLRASIFTYHPFKNRVLNVGTIIGLSLTALAIYHPFMQDTLHTVTLPLPWAIGVVCVGLFNVMLVELGKWALRSRTGE